MRDSYKNIFAELLLDGDARVGFHMQEDGLYESKSKKGIRHFDNGKSSLLNGCTVVDLCEFDHVFDPLSRENPFHFRAFPIPAGVDIALHCNVRTGVTQ